MVEDQFENHKKSIIINPLLDSNQTMLSALKTIITDRFFSVVEIWDTFNPEILDYIRVHSDIIEFDVSLSPTLVRRGYALAIGSTNVIPYIKDRISILSSCGVRSISISSPNVFESIDRSKQIDILTNEIHDICHFAKQYNSTVSFELFDIYEDKKRVIGTSSDIFAFFKAVDCDNLFLTWDLGHVCLNHENYILSLEMLIRFIKRIHISNYSLKQGLFFGDKHLPFNDIGEIHENDITAICNYLKQIRTELSVAFEVATNKHFNIVKSFKKTYDYICSLESQYIRERN